MTRSPGASPELYTKHVLIYIMGNDVVTYNGQLREDLAQGVLQTAEEMAQYCSLLRKVNLVSPGLDDNWGLPGFQEKFEPILRHFHENNILMCNEGNVISALVKPPGDKFHSQALRTYTTSTGLPKPFARLTRF